MISSTCETNLAQFERCAASVYPDPAPGGTPPDGPVTPPGHPPEPELPIPADPPPADPGTEVPLPPMRQAAGLHRPLT